MRDTKANSKNTFNQQAKTYDTDMNGQHARSLYPILLERLSEIPFHTALDLGCGTGEMIKLLLEQNEQIHLYGVDISENMLAVAKEKLGEKATLVLGDSENLPFQKDMFDVVYCNDSFHHYPKPERVLEEIRRVLKPGGSFLMGDCWQPPLGRAIMNFYMKHSKEGDVKIYSKQEILSLLSVPFHSVGWQQIGTTACIAWGKK